MIYPMHIEADPHHGGIWARFIDVPSADFWESESDRATKGAVNSLTHALVTLFQTGSPMPVPSPIAEGQLGVASPVTWHGVRSLPDMADD